MTAQVTNDNAAANGAVPRAPAACRSPGTSCSGGDPVKLLTGAARQGDVVRLELPGETYFLSHPKHVKHVLQDNHQNYCKGWVFDRIKPYWGESLLTADGDTWRQQRRRVQPSFKREHTAAFAPIVTARTAEMLARWEKIAAARQELALYNEMTELALVIIGDVLFGVDLWADAAEMARCGADPRWPSSRNASPRWRRCRSGCRPATTAASTARCACSTSGSRRSSSASGRRRRGAKLPRDADGGARRRDRRGDDRPATA